MMNGLFVIKFVTRRVKVYKAKENVTNDHYTIYTRYIERKGETKTGREKELTGRTIVGSKLGLKCIKE